MADIRTNVQWATLAHARDIAGGVSLLSHAIGVAANELDGMLHGTAPIPQWLFLRVADYIREHRAAKPARFLPEFHPSKVIRTPPEKND